MRTKGQRLTQTYLTIEVRKRGTPGDRQSRWRGKRSGRLLRASRAHAHSCRSVRRVGLRDFEPWKCSDPSKLLTFANPRHLVIFSSNVVRLTIALARAFAAAWVAELCVEQTDEVADKSSAAKRTASNSHTCPPGNSFPCAWWLAFQTFSGGPANLEPLLPTRQSRGFRYLAMRIRRLTKAGIDGKVCSTSRRWKELEKFPGDRTHGPLQGFRHCRCKGATRLCTTLVKHKNRFFGVQDGKPKKPRIVWGSLGYIPKPRDA